MMKKVDKDYLVNIKGGMTFNSTMINALVKGGKLLFELGRSLGTSIRRVIGGKTCPIV